MAQLKGKDIEVGTVIGTRKVREVLFRRKQWVYYSYDYKVANEKGEVSWYRQTPAPVGRIAVNKVIPRDEVFFETKGKREGLSR